MAARQGRDAGPLTAARRAAQQPGPAKRGHARSRQPSISRRGRRRRHEQLAGPCMGLRPSYCSTSCRHLAVGTKHALAGITHPEEASAAQHELADFLPVGKHTNAEFKFGASHDVGISQVPVCKSAQLASTKPCAAQLRLIDRSEDHRYVEPRSSGPILLGNARRLEARALS